MLVPWGSACCGDAWSRTSSSARRSHSPTSHPWARRVAGKARKCSSHRWRATSSMAGEASRPRTVASGCVRRIVVLRAVPQPRSTRSGRGGRVGRRGARRVRKRWVESGGRKLGEAS